MNGSEVTKPCLQSYQLKEQTSHLTTVYMARKEQQAQCNVTFEEKDASGGASTQSYTAEEYKAVNKTPEKQRRHTVLGQSCSQRSRL